MFTITNPTDAVHPQLTALLALLTPTYKSEFPVEVKTLPNSVYFIDSRYSIEHPEYTSDDRFLGHVRWDSEKQAFIVSSSRIKVAGRKPRRGMAKLRNYKRTKSLKAAAKLVLEFFHPFSVGEMARVIGGNPRRDVSQWALEPNSELNDLTRLVPSSTLLEEVSFLAAQGAQFKTEVFRKLAQQGVALAEERRRRERERDTCVSAFLFTQPNGRISTTFISTRNGVTATADTEYPNEDAVPSLMQDKIALLRFSDPDVFVPEVGRRVVKAFWLVLSEDEARAVGVGA